MNILSLFCDIDSFCLLFEPTWKRRLLASGTLRRHKPGALSPSEVMTTLMLFHLSGYSNFKAFYTEHVMRYLAGAFHKLTGYSRFVELQRDALVPLWRYLHALRPMHGHRVHGRHHAGRLSQPPHPSLFGIAA